MNAAVVTAATTLACTHGGPATVTKSSTSVTVAGSPVVTVTPSPSYSVACTAASVGPCVTAMWAAGAAKVFSHGMALAVQDGTSICQPTLVRLEIQAIQHSVEAL